MIRIASIRAGSGPSLVMVHGAPADSRTSQWMLPDLARDHTLIAWDAPGCGPSSDIDDTWRAPHFADALAAFLAALGLERPHLVGHSFGTMVALSLFERHPAVPGSLVLEEVVCAEHGAGSNRQHRTQLGALGKT